MTRNYFLPKNLQPELRKVWGIPIFGKKKTVEKKFKDFIKKRGFKKIITVGDYCSLNLPSHIKIFDGRVKRKEIKLPRDWKKNCLIASNPAGTIQDEAWQKIKEAIKKRKNVFINGEEDLLVIPCVLLAEKNSAVVYGFPSKGICLIEVLPQIKKAFKELLKKFRTR